MAAPPALRCHERLRLVATHRLVRLEAELVTPQFGPLALAQVDVVRRAAFEVVDLQAAPAVLDEESRGLEMGVAADHGARVGIKSVNDFLSAVEAGVDEDDPLATAR